MITRNHIYLKMNVKIILTILSFGQLIASDGAQLTARANSRAIATRYGGLSPRSMNLLRILLKRKLKYGKAFFICPKSE